MVNEQANSAGQHLRADQPVAPSASHCSLTPSPSGEEGGEKARHRMVYSWFESFDSGTAVWEWARYTVQACTRITLLVTVIMQHELQC